MPAALYIEHDAYAAQWLRNLIAADLIAPGEVYEKDIRDIRPNELAGFTQVHAFAGIGVWSYALRCAGWPDDRPVWTASCPCQPFSAAGKGDGVDDERHLWPHFFHLLQHAKSRDVPLLGEQVATTDGLGWLDLVCDDLEAQAHACWPFDLCAAGFGAPHIRQRLYFAAAALECLGGAAAAEMVDSIGAGLERQRRNVDGGGQSGRIGTDETGPVAETGTVGELACSEGLGRNQSAERLQRVRQHGQRTENRGAGDGNKTPGPVNGFWRDADWLFCRDGKWRPVESGTFPLVDGSAFRMGSGSTFEGKSRANMLRGYGNAIVAAQAEDFIKSVMEVLP